MVVATKEKRSAFCWLRTPDRHPLYTYYPSRASTRL